MRNLLEYIVKQIVSKPEAVKVEESTDNLGYVHLKLSLDPEDIGLVIGKKGRIIRAIRNLVKVKAIKEGKRVNVELVEMGDRPSALEDQPR